MLFPIVFWGLFIFFIIFSPLLLFILQNTDDNGCRIYVYIMTSIFVVISPVIYWSVCLSRRRGGDAVKGWRKGMFILVSYKFHFIREHDNLVYDPNNNKSINV